MSASADDVFVLWAIFDHPRDYPEHFVVRRQFVKRAASGTVPRDLAPHGTTATDDPRIELDARPRLAATLDAARAMLPPGLARLAPQPDDAPAIAEVWI